ncbi:MULTISPECIES: hypothetical protein [unclassified Vibrio]|uniref:hypothetical protein n=1 Tax=unclassified Vibrio TaxID=2614977 RepID=UPI001E5500AC|nr:hypothetical protein [Vibrio sp. F13]MCC4889905.1 hypothetical protein [Vibrio sp. F13]
MHRRKWAITLKTRQIVKYLLHTKPHNNKVSAIKGLKEGGLIYSRARDVIELLHVIFLAKAERDKCMLNVKRASQNR